MGDRQTEKENIDTAQEALEEKLSTDLEYLLYKLVIQNGTDLFSIHDLVRRQFSDFYEQNKDNFSDILQDSKIYLQLQADVYQATGR